MLTIASKNREIDCTYGGFARLREIASKIAGGEFYEIYHFPFEHYSELIDPKTSETANLVYSRKIEAVERKYSSDIAGIINFLTACDAGGKLTESQCLKLTDLFRNATEEQLNISINSYQPTLVRDFVEMLCDGAEEGGIEWY